MSLAPRERQKLSQIESGLRQSDPRLETLLTQWPAGGRRRRLVLAGLRRFRALHGELSRLLLVALVLFSLLAIAVVGALTTSPGPGQPVQRATPVSGHLHGPYT